MIKKGFTMAELLITLSIIGILAALTIPALSSSTEKQQVGPALIKAISALENGNAVMIAQNDMYGIRENCGLPVGDADIAGSEGKNYETNCFERHIMPKLGAVKLDKSVSYYSSNYNQQTTYNPSTSYIYQSKNGAAYIFPTNNYNNHYIEVLIDTNGVEKKPNQMAKDLFKVIIDVDREGSVIPVGSKRYAAATGGDSWADNKCGANNTINNVQWDTCAGSITDNNGKIIYKW